MYSTPHPLKLHVPPLYLPYVEYARALDKFNDHTEDLQGVLAFIEHRNPAAKEKGLSGDEAMDYLADLLKVYFVAVRTNKESPTIFAKFFADYEVNKDGVDYFGYWLASYTTKARNFFTAKEELRELVS